MVDEFNVDKRVNNTPADIVKLFANKANVVHTVLIELYDVDDNVVIVVSIRLRFWNSLWALINSNYRESVLSLYTQQINSIVPSSVKLFVILAI